MSPRRTLCYYCPVNGCVTRIHPAANNPPSTLPSHSSGTQSSTIQVCDYRPTVVQMPLVSTPLDLDPAPSDRLSVCLPAEAACACAAPVTCEWILRTIPPETMIKNPKWRLYIVYKCPFFKIFCTSQTADIYNSCLFMYKLLSCTDSTVSGIKCFFAI